MVSRAYPSGNAPPEVQTALAQAWDLAARANRLEGEVASHTRKLEALERRGRALRAEIGRKVEELAHEESRVLREAAAEPAKRQRRSARARPGRREARRDREGASRRRRAQQGRRTRARSSSAPAPPRRSSQAKRE